MRKVPVQSRSTAMGFFQAAYAIGLSAGPTAVGVLIDLTGYRLSFDLIALLSVVNIGLTMRFLEKDSASA